MLGVFFQSAFQGNDFSPRDHGTDIHSPVIRSLACSHAEIRTYIVTVETCKSRWMGTEVQVCIQLSREHGATEAIPLQKSNCVTTALCPSRSPGRLGFWKAPCACSDFEGNLRKFCVFHGSVEDYGYAASWHPERVAVHDDTLARTWHFNCETWLSRDADNEIELYPSQVIAVRR